jgi:hypothetical protein
MSCADDDRMFIMEDAVPDPPSVPVSPLVQTEAIVGWRVWKVTSDGSLRSVFMSNVWPDGKAMKACCAGSTRLQHGIHAFSERFAAEEYYGDEMRTTDIRGAAKCVIGQVSLWGNVVVHESGYRAAFAYPRMILVPLGIASVANGLRRLYGVEVGVW